MDLADLRKMLDAIEARGETISSRPRLFSATKAADREALAELARSGEVLFVHDEMHGQLAELIETRHAHRKFTSDEIAQAVEGHLRDTPASAYGTWAFYPWSRRLVHVLPEAEYRELRTSRNRNKITREEQARLATLKLGVVGLSVGQATAVTLALEGIGGEFRLADFDTLSLSNMNRLRAGAHSIGVNKAVLTAREITEIDPYAHVVLFPTGITDETFSSFFDGGASGTGPLDILFEECDDLRMKVRLREEARRRRIPVLMETSDRGLLDVERFDLEPDRPLLHGLVANIESDRLRNMTTYEKVPFALRIMDGRTLSPRMTASFVDIDATLRTWPQLASAVALGGALNTDAARRIVLGTFHKSGRFFTDIERIVSDDGAVPIYPEPEESTEPAPAPASPPPVVIVRAEPDAGTIRALVTYATLAPSGGNCQPWKFDYRDRTLAFLHDVGRSRTFLDFEHRAAYLAFGAAAENMDQTARAAGLALGFHPFPDPNDRHRVCDVTIARGSVPNEAELRAPERIAQRVTNRRLGTRVPLDEGDARTLHAEAESAGAHLQLLTQPEALARIAHVLGRGDRLRILSPVMHHEMMSEVRWSAREAESTRDGLDLATLELTPTDLAGMRLLRRWPLVETLARVGGGAGLDVPAHKSVAAASAVALLTMPGTDGATYFRGGRALQRVWLAATERGFAFQPMSALVYLFARLDAGGDDLAPEQRAELTHLRHLYRELFTVPAGHAELLLFRLARTGPPTARSLRRHVSDLLTFAP